MDPLTSVTMASDVANSQVVWSILCIGLTVYVLWNGKREKDALLENLRELTKSQTSQVEALKDISRSLDSLERRMEHLERKADNDGR